MKIYASHFNLNYETQEKKPMDQKVNTTELSKTSMTLPSLNSTSAAVAVLNAGGVSHFLANVPSRIQQVLDRPPVSELIRAGAKRNSIEATLAAEIVRTSNRLTVGGNLREGQALEIAIGLLADYPNESLEDFCLCFRLGLKGAYGDIFRFDALVANTWMRAYLEKKYQVAEDELMKEKDTFKNNLVWKREVVPDEKAKEYLKKWEQNVLNSKVEVTDEYMKEVKQRGTGYKDPHPPEYYEMRDKIRRTASEFYKDKYSFSGMQVWKVGEYEVFAESLADAEEIVKHAQI